MTRFCANCGTPLREGCAFCEKCGTAAQADPAAEAVAPAAFAEPAADSLAGDPLQDPTASAPQGPGTGPIYNAGGARKTSGLAIAAMVLGIISIVSCTMFVGVAFGIAAIVLYVVAKKKYGKSGIGLAGLITGIVGTVLSLIFAVVLGVLIAGAIAGGSHDDGLIGDILTEGSLSSHGIVGTWELDDDYSEFIFDGTNETFTEAELKAMMAADDVHLRVKDDGTFGMTYGADSKTGTWVDQKNIVLFYVDGADEPLFGCAISYGGEYDGRIVPDNDVLYLVDGENFLLFERE